MTPERFSSYQYGEGRTGIGQMLQFTCPSGTIQEISQFLQENVRTIDVPTTGRVSVSHGSYGQYTRYNVKQHKYAGGGPNECGGGGFIEVLEIKDPPNGRCGFVINEYSVGPRAAFTEWDTLKCAIAAFKKFWSSHDTAEQFADLPGFKRRVACGALTPWFYAIGDEQLVGDYAFPEGLQDDAVYRFGREFVIFDREDTPALKTCMGTRFVKRRSDHYSCGEQAYRLVYWDDGSVWDESEDRANPPRPAEDGELWIAEALHQFRQMLAGRSTKFTINFTDGTKFVGRLAGENRLVPCPEGDYLLVVRFKGKKTPREGWVRDFAPTEEAPDIVQYVTQRCAGDGDIVEHVEIKKCRTKKDGKKWTGAFFSHSRLGE